MKTRPANFAAAFTLVELMMATAVLVVIMTGLIFGAVALQRSFSATEYYAEAVNDQSRALDYISRDTRAALSIAVSADQNTLTLTLPDYYTAYDSQGNPTGTPVDPTFTHNVVNYGDTTKPITVTYTITNGSLIKQVLVGATNTTSQAVIATRIDNFDFTFASLNSAAKTSLTFSPRFRGPEAATDTKTTLSTTVYMRNPLR